MNRNIFQRLRDTYPQKLGRPPSSAYHESHKVTRRLHSYICSDVQASMISLVQWLWTTAMGRG